MIYHRAAWLKAKVTSGFHVAFIELIDKNTGAVMQLVPLSLKVPDVPKILGAGMERYDATLAPRRADTRLIYMGDYVQAVHFAMQIPYERDDASGYMPGLRGRRPGGKPATGDPVDAAHHIGPMESFDSLVANEKGGFQEVGWENRAFHAEYETPYDPPAPTVSITPTVTVTKYAVALKRDGNDTLTVSNRLADIEGRVELYNARLNTEQLAASGPHASAELDRKVPANLVQWRVRVASDGTSSEPADVYLLNCTGKEGCSVAAQQEISSNSETVNIEKPAEGDWKIVVRARGQMSPPVKYEVREALLVPGEAIDPEKSRHASGATWTLPLPAKRSEARYAAFRIAGTPGNEGEKKGLTVAMTPLDGNAP